MGFARGPQWSRSQALAAIASRHLGIADMPSELNDRAVRGKSERSQLRSGAHKHAGTPSCQVNRNPACQGTADDRRACVISARLPAGVVGYFISRMAASIGSEQAFCSAPNLLSTGQGSAALFGAALKSGTGAPLIASMLCAELIDHREAAISFFSAPAISRPPSRAEQFTVARQKVVLRGMGTPQLITADIPNKRHRPAALLRLTGATDGVNKPGGAIV